MIAQTLGNGEAHHVLVASRDRQTRDSWVDGLVSEGFECQAVKTVRQARESLRRESFKIAVFEDGLSGGDVLDAWHTIGKETRPGLIFVGLEPWGERRIQVLRQGVDHYLCRPVQSTEILYAVRNLMHRVDPGWSMGWMLDPLKWRLFGPNTRTRSLRLTLKEKILLRALMERAGTPVPRDELAWFMEADARVKNSRGMEIMVRRLRKKISDAFGVDAPLVTLHGVGYAFTATATVLEDDLSTDDADAVSDGEPSAD